MNTETKIVTSLENPASYLENIKAVVADIDYTLVDFDVAHQAGLQELAKVLGEDITKEVDELFSLTVEGHRRPLSEPWEHRPTFDAMRQATEEAHQSFSAMHGAKVWSRETWIYLVSKELGKTLTHSEIEAGRDAYWLTLTENSILYPDAQELITYLKEKNIPLILMTGSDAVLKLGEGPTFHYDPTYSHDYKKKRLTILPLEPHDIIIGDPIDKPDPRFFERVATLLDEISIRSPEQVLFVGDSLRNDLEGPQTLGYQTLLVKRST